MPDLLGQGYRDDIDPLVRVKLERGEPSDGRDVLILFSDRLLQPFDLDIARVRGNLLVGDDLVLERVQRLQHTDRERTRRAQTGPGGNVGHRRDLDRRSEPGLEQALAQQRMRDVLAHA